jgi:hypothetical protein
MDAVVGENGSVTAAAGRVTDEKHVKSAAMRTAWELRMA